MRQSANGKGPTNEWYEKYEETGKSVTVTRELRQRERRSSEQEGTQAPARAEGVRERTPDASVTARAAAAENNEGDGYERGERSVGRRRVRGGGEARERRGQREGLGRAEGGEPDDRVSNAK